MSDSYESYDRPHPATKGDINMRIAILETRVSAMDKGLDRLAVVLESTNKEIHAIRELIAAGKGAWWAGAVIFGCIATLAGIIGAAVHKIMWP